MQFEPLIYWLLGASWLLLILVIVLQVLGTRRRRAAAARIAELEKALSDEREREYDRRMEMAENSLRLLELKESLESEKERSAKLLRNILPAVAGAFGSGDLRACDGVFFRHRRFHAPEFSDETGRGDRGTFFDFH